MPKTLQDWLSWLIKLRIVVATTLLGVSLGISSILSDNTMLSSLAGIIGGSYLASLCFWVLLTFSRHYLLQACIQTLADQLIIFAIVYVTGGLDSAFSILYLLSIIMTSILLYRRGAFVVATTSSLLTIAQWLVVHWGILPYTGFGRLERGTIDYYFATNIFAFFAVAYLSSHLSESLRKTGRELEDKSGKLANLQAFNENIINSMRGGLCTTNLDGLITLFNKSAVEITGFKADQVIGTPVSSLFKFSEANLLFPCSLSPVRFEKSICNAQGRELYLGFTMSPLLAENQQHLGYVYTFQDLTEIKVLEDQVRQKEQMAAVGRMAAGIAHEIRNPLTAISGSFKLLRPNWDGDAGQVKLAETIAVEIKRLYKIITDFLAYSRPTPFSPHQVDLFRLAQDMVQLLKHSPELSPQHQIECVSESTLPLLCEVDPDLMRQLFWNLLTNALKAMPAGGQLSICVRPGNDDQVGISIRDTGIGMTEEEKAKAFEPFHAGFKNGTGLGLPIVSQIVKTHNGMVRLWSESGKGTTFEIELPRSQPHPTREAQTADSPSALG